MVSDNLKALYEKLPSAVKLVAVSKFHPVSRLMEAYNAGQRVFGENRPQELAQKVPQMPSDVEWHFIGHLQTNKLKLVLPYVSLVQSVDSLHLLEAIDKWGRENGKTIDVLLELHLGAEETKHGFSEDEILMLLSSGSTPSENLRSQSDLRPSHKWAPPSNVPRVAQFSDPLPTSVNAFKSVVFPEPFGPARRMTSPGAISKEMSRTRIRSPYPMERLSTWMAVFFILLTVNLLLKVLYVFWHKAVCVNR